MRIATGHGGRFPLVDSMRGLAALSIVALHISFANGLARDGVLAPYAARLEVGVAVFFLISGFLLYRPFAASRLERERRPRTAAYAWRRLLRIGPAYWVALTVLALLAGAKIVLEDPLLFYGFAQVYDRYTALSFDGFLQAWTLCVEVSFYVFLPVWALLMRALPVRGRRSWLATELVALAVLAAIGVAYKLVVLDTGDATSPALLWLPAFLDQFALGMALAVLSVWWQDRPLPALLQPLDRLPGIAWVLALVAFWAVSTQIGIGGGFATFTENSWMARHLLFAAVALLVLLPVIFGDQARGVLRRVLRARVLVFLGVVSYGIYLWHLGVIVQLQRLGLEPATSAAPIRLVLYPALIVLATVAVATVSYLAIERPALSLKARVSHVKTLEAGSRLSYGLRYQLDHRATIATVPIGYADGVPRNLAAVGGEVVIGGRRRPVAGTVTMDQLMVDVGDATVEVGDEVVLLGRDGDAEITADEWADRLGTIGYEIVCGIGRRVPRTYV